MIERINSLRTLDEIENITNSTTTNSTITLMSEKHVWGSAIAVSIGLLLLSLILTLCIVLCHSKKVSRNCISLINMCLISLAVGSLVGDSVIHIIPAVFGSHESEEEHDHVEGGEEEAETTTNSKPDARVSSTMILVGFLSFFIIEKIFLASGCGHSHGDGEEDHDHEGHSHCEGHGHSDHSHNDHKKTKEEIQNQYGKKNN